MVSHPFTIPVLIDPNAARGPQFAPPPPRRSGERDPFVEAMLELPSVRHAHRNPLDWAFSLVVHFALIGAIIAVPLYFTDSIDLKAYNITTLIAVPPPPPPPPPPAGSMTRQITHPTARFMQHNGLILPTIIPRKIAMIHEEVVPGENEGVVGGVPGGIPGGVLGGVLGGTLGGVLGSAGTGAPPPPKAAATKKILRVGGNVKPPRLIYQPPSVYPLIAKNAHVQGTVIIDAIIDEHGNVVEAKVISGPTLLIAAALQNITSWRYEPTYLDGEPIEVRMHVDVNFFLQ